MTASACSAPVEPPPQVRTVLVAPPVPAEARHPCGLSDLPDRRLSEAEATRLWGQDRTTIRICDRRRALAVGALDAAQRSAP